MSDIFAVFPGQGAQQVGMCRDLAEQFSLVRETFEEASDAIGIDLWALSSDGPSEILNQTSFTQPALLAASIACYRVALQSVPELNIIAAAGHSLGEYSALVASGAVDFAVATRLVRKRGELMEAAVPDGQGGMAAVLGLDVEQIEELCQQLSGEFVVEPANINAPGQVVVAGHAVAIENFTKAAKAAGARRALPLAVSGPFHSSLMRPAAEEFLAIAQDIDWLPTTFPVLHNVGNAQAAITDIPAKLASQLYSPVKWTEAVRELTLQSQGVTTAVEFGPGKVLAGLIKRIDRSITVYQSDSSDAITQLVK